MHNSDLINPTKLLSTLLCSSLILVGCHAKHEDEQESVRVVGPNKLQVSSDAMANLHLAEAKLESFPETLSIMGKISATEDLTHVVPARVTGRIEKVLISSGETVKPGQALALLWSPDFVTAREEYLQSLRRQDDDFRSLAALARKKLESMGLTQADIELLTKAAKTTDENQEKVEKYLTVRAPRAGAVISKNAILGNQVNLGEALFMIADLHQVWFLGDLYPEDLEKVKKDQEVVVDTLIHGKQLRGKVSFISPIIDPSSRTIKIRALMENPDLTLRGDMYLQGNLVLSDRKAIVIPSQSILRDQNESFVFRIQGPKMVEGHSVGVEAQRVKISILGERQGLVAIAGGLNEKDQVVSDGALLLNAILNNSSGSK